MRKLLVIRHGKSLRGPEYATDFERPLAARGIKAAGRMARWMLEHDQVPSLVVSSPAKRARQTAELILEELGTAALWDDEAIYDADVDDLLGVVRGFPAEDETVLLVGHNFGLEYFVDALAGTTDTILKTCSLAVIEFPADSWAGIDRGGGTVLELVHPRELDS